MELEKLFKNIGDNESIQKEIEYARSEIDKLKAKRESAEDQFQALYIDDNVDRCEIAIYNTEITQKITDAFHEIIAPSCSKIIYSLIGDKKIMRNVYRSMQKCFEENYSDFSAKKEEAMIEGRSIANSCIDIKNSIYEMEEKIEISYKEMQGSKDGSEILYNKYREKRDELCLERQKRTNKLRQKDRRYRTYSQWLEFYDFVKNEADRLDKEIAA